MAYLVTKSGAGVEIEISDDQLELLQKHLDKGDVIVEVQ